MLQSRTMPSQHKHPPRKVHGIDQQLWDEFAESCAEKDTERSPVLRQFMRWYIGREDVPLPERPSK